MRHTVKAFKQHLTLALCGAILFSGMVGQVVMADEDISVEERRKLAKFPQLTVSRVLSGKFQDDLERYLSDAFPLRPSFRKLKAAAVLQLFGKGDLGGLYSVMGHLSKIEAETNDKQIDYAAKRIEQIRQKYLADMRVYYAVIPDKHYFLGPNGGYPTMDYEHLLSTLREGLSSIKGIELFDTLNIDAYYTTDPHIKQTSLEPLVKKLAEAMGFVSKPFESYEPITHGPFHGAYAGQIGLAVDPDQLVYLMDASLKEASVYDLEKNRWQAVYQTEADLTMDGYALFMGGASAIQIIENPHGKTGKELILFRDSFGSAIAPLLLGGYDKITLIDLRYVSSEVLDQFVSFEDQDVLFLYATSVINSGGALFR
ncbi:MAG TPA: hypothetical protein DCS67_09670 [Clostridiales bacterium UBA8960]|nr:hypothetical protein [Clostridiales bacterium UBA8960]